MPGPHNRNSFSYRTIHPVIRSVLDARSMLDNTTQEAMPFVKATTTIRLKEYLGEGNTGFTLGLHAIDQDQRLEDIYSDGDSSPLLGYTYTPGSNGKNGTTKRVYAKRDSIQMTAERLFDVGTEVANTPGADFIPPPGITSVTVGRNKSGLLAYGEIHFSVPSLIQLEVLHRVFLIPGCGMVLEWGQQFAPEQAPSFGEMGLDLSTPITEKMFPWYDKDKLDTMLTKLGQNKVGLEEILKDYVHPTQGQYMWMFGRIANFDVKSNSDGSFDCVVKIVGPSEDAWAYSTRNTIIPPRDHSGTICPDSTNSVESYFSQTVPGLNLKTLLESTMGGLTPELKEWKTHVQKFDKGNKISGEPGIWNGIKRFFNSDTNASETSFADSQDAYFMTWRFFVNVVLNDSELGVRAIFKKAHLTTAELDKIVTLRPYDGSAAGVIDDDYENFVGNNVFLRSIDPSTLIIINDAAAAATSGTANLHRAEIIDDISQVTDLSKKFAALGDFHEAVNTIGITGEPPDRGLLSTGVWLNHKAVAQSMLSADTVIRGIINLLDRMNAATMGYWQLTIDPSEPGLKDGVVDNSPNARAMNYAVVDMNYKENAEYAVSEFMNAASDKRVHVFNKYGRTIDGKYVGSDVLECTVDLALPKRMFSQIATMGLVQPSDIQAAGGGEGEAPATQSPILGDPNETLRKMFAITTISTTEPNEQGPDATIAPKAERDALLRNATCGKQSSSTTAAADGVGRAVNTTNAQDDISKKPKSELEDLRDSAQKTIDSDECKECAKNPSPQAPPTPSQAAIPITPPPPNICDTLKNATEVAFCKQAYTSGITDPVELAQLLAQVKTESQFRPVEETLRYSAQFLFSNFPYTATRPWGFKSEAEAATVCCGKDRVALANRIYGSRMGNTSPGDGFKYRGRGFIQLTGKSNYVAYGYANNPDALLTFQGAADSAITYWKKRVRNNSRVTSFSDTTAVTRAINGGTIGLTSRQRSFTQFSTLFASTIPATPAPASPPPSSPVASSPPRTVTGCVECTKARHQLAQTTAQIEDNAAADAGKDRIVREFPGLEAIFRYVEPYPDLMVSNIARESNGNRSNAFGSAPGTLSISADITLPGINGLRVGELFWIDRIPAFYRAFGAFQIISIEESIGTDGWKTKIHSRFNYLGDAWRKETYKKLGQVTAAATVAKYLATNPIFLRP